MKHKYFKVGTLYGLITVVGVYLIGKLANDTNAYMWFVISILVGLITAIMIYMLNQLMDRKVHRRLSGLEAELQQNDKILIEGPAGKSSLKRSMGKLFLTRNQLLYKSISDKQLNYSLEDVSNVRLCKKWLFFNNGLKFSYDGREEEYHVDYPGDWKAIIEYVKEIK
ncbi:MAG: hypothetical protein MI866_06630 [Bacteroidales bacterium]|nr:hypothetical protein [Bacteroidales bacterium]